MHTNWTSVAAKANLIIFPLLFRSAAVPVSSGADNLTSVAISNGINPHSSISSSKGDNVIVVSSKFLIYHYDYS